MQITLDLWPLRSRSTRILVKMMYKGKIVEPPILDISVARLLATANKEGTGVFFHHTPPNRAGVKTRVCFFKDRV